MRQFNYTQYLTVSSFLPAIVLVMPPKAAVLSSSDITRLKEAEYTLTLVLAAGFVNITFIRRSPLSGLYGLGAISASLISNASGITAVGVAVIVAVGVHAAVIVKVGLGVAVKVPVCVIVAVLLGEGVREASGVRVKVGGSVTVRVGLITAVCVRVAVVVTVMVFSGVDEGVFCGVAD